MASQEISSDLSGADTRFHDQGGGFNPIENERSLRECDALALERGRLLLEHFVIIGILLASAINAVLHDTRAQSVPHQSHGILVRLTSEPGSHASHVVNPHANGQGWGAFAPLH